MGERAFPCGCGINVDFQSLQKIKENIRLTGELSTAERKLLTDTNKLETQKQKIIATKSESILHLSDGSSRNDYKTDLVPEIVGSNYEDLKIKVNEYLDNLMSIINVPYCECPHCQGWGLIKEEDLKNEEVQ